MSFYIMFVAASLSKCSQYWLEIGAPAFIVQWITKGVPLIFKEQPCPFHLNNHVLNEKERTFVQEEINSLLNCGAIEKCDFIPNFVSPIGCVPKKGGKLRMIVDLRQLNKYCEIPKFSQEDIRCALSLVSSDDYMITCDLKSGFHHVPLDSDYQNYITFCWNGVYYKWKVIPFGLCLSPYYFCKIVRSVIQYFRSQGLRVMAYVDDFLLAATNTDIQNQRDYFLDTLQNLGWHVSWEKSSLDPSQAKRYLGYLLNTAVVPEIKIPQDRIRHLKRDIRRALNSATISAKSLARIAGQCISMSLAVIPGKLLLRNTYRLLAKRKSWEDRMIIDLETQRDLNWWLHAFKDWNGRVVKQNVIQEQIFTDASAIGWGAHLQNRKASGHWNYQLFKKTSNYRELMAVRLALLSFAPYIQGKCVQIVSDNITTVAYLNHLGGPVQELSVLTETIFTEAQQANVTLSARFLAGKHNTEADRLSRLNAYSWKLHPNLFRYLDRIWGPHTIDRFASANNAQISVYNSQYHDFASSGVDALAQQDWHIHNNFVNPPFRLMPKVLDVISSQSAVATVIAPAWPAQPWYRRLLSMAVTNPIKLPNSNRTIWRMGPIPEPLKNPRWTIYAWRICGKNDYKN